MISSAFFQMCQWLVAHKSGGGLEAGKSYLGATDGDVDGDLLVTADTEVTDGVTGLAWRTRVSRDKPEERRRGFFSGSFLSLTVDGSLTRKLLEHLGGTGEPVTRLADGDVEDELLDLELPHGVLSLLGRHCESSDVLVKRLGGWARNWADVRMG